MSDFETELKRLNKEQKLAVEAIEGPVMVLAGPGTGKTQVVAMRIAQILLKTQLKPQNILALTFTEAGVTALRDRLVKLVGPDGYLVTIATFHGFANEIIGTFPHVFPQVQSGSNLNELERIGVVEDILESGHVGSVLRPMRKSSHYVKDIVSTIKTAKQEAITSEKITEAAENIPEDGKELTKIDRENNARKKLILKEFALVFQSYQNRLEADGTYDYEDMILMVLEAIKTNPEIRAHFQERYQYILVDEYQDTNTAQNQLVELLADFFDNPNLFVVGDDKQAIYRFQGASVANMSYFQKKYPQMKLISLKDNYRSSPEILKVADALIDNNTQQIKKFLKSPIFDLSPTKASGETPTIFSCPTPLSQEQKIIEQIKESQRKGMSYLDIAVIWRRNAEANRFRRALEKAGIPLSGEKQVDLMSEPIVRALISALTAVSNPMNNQAVFFCTKLLLDEKHLLELFATSRAHARSRSSFIEVMEKSTSTHIKKIASNILKWNKLSDTLPIFELIEKVVEESALVNKIRPDQNGIADLDLMKAILDMAYDFSLRNQSATLKDWLRHLSLTKEYKLPIKINRNVAQEGVTVTTVHGVKGLEYSLVIMAGVDERQWSTKAQRDLIPLPAELIGLKNWQDDVTEDERRLFYVGITRAKENLIFTYSATDIDGKERLGAQFMAEIKPVCQESTYQPALKNIALFETESIKPKSDELARSEELSFIRQKVREQGFSATDLRAYQHCPRQYLMTRILKIPTLPSSALVFGNAIHKALELFFREYKGFKTLPPKQTLINFYQEALTKSLPFQERQQYFAKGEGILSAFYDAKAADWTAPVGVEYTFSPHKVMLDDIWLTGKFDRIDPIGKDNAVRVVDYKTGSKAKSRNVIEGKTLNSQGEIKQQLVYYALLAKHDRLFPYKAKDFRVAFVDDELTFKQEDFEIVESEIKELEQKIKDTYKEILTRTDFPHTADSYENGCEVCELFPN